jgi:NAD(P)-dependent dehydrogenase (short-subunit alcohol dehydrogenase family)
MALIGQRVVIFDNDTQVGEAAARLAAALGAKVTLVKHEPGAVLGVERPGPALYETVSLDLSRPAAVDAWLAAFPGPIDHLLIGHFAGPEPLSGAVGENRPPWTGAYQWAYDLARRRGPGVGQSVALFSGPVVIPAGPGGASIAAEVADGYLRGLAQALQPLRVNAVWTEPIRSPLPADAPVQARQALYLSSAPHTRSRSDIGEDVAGALLYLMNGPALSGSVLRISHAAPVPAEAW